MTVTDIKNAITLAAHGLTAFGTVADVARALVAKNSTIEEVYPYLHAIIALANTLDRGIAGEISVTAVENEILKLRDATAGNDLAADHAVDAKFPK